LTSGLGASKTELIESGRHYPGDALSYRHIDRDTCIELAMTAETAEPTRSLPEVGSDPLRCLWLTRVDPVTLDAGDLTYSFHLLSSLSRSGVRLAVLALRRAGDRTKKATIDNGVEWSILPWESNREIGGRFAIRSIFSRLPNVASQYNTASFRRALRVQMVRDWDTIVVDHLGMGWVWPWVEAYRRRKPTVVSVFIAHQREGEARRRMARNFRGNILRKIGLCADTAKVDRLEKKLVSQSNLVSAITAEDLRGFGSLDKIVLLPPGYASPHVVYREINDSTPRRAVILGSAVWLAKQMNLIEFLATADELFHQRRIELWVVGNVPDHLRVKNHFHAARLLGFVADLGPILSSVRIGIVAERTGGGFKLKTLDYIFNRVPIAAIKGSIAGLPLTPEVDYLSFESMQELAQGIAAVIDDTGRLNSLQQAAYKKCESGFDWSDRGRTLRDAIRQTMSRKRPAACCPTRDGTQVELDASPAVDQP
jgi:polysaccharide biosynthesis protein PslH